ncbi:hypothetical protein HYH02_014543 [Chlamydomonas schloesseri]|uniref:EF-hand domain-containing protein n=1 Tax=Chlamydomonas schloesseri TaxID=2026947 RepID=A0A835SMF9_9CHLO|nr:hypothetical protein HYH02_014543 [Chlamydomonas schloesseri]|eukprot:KAG2427712.1 hypothetical protein HYH02_014543 [Chlamydomonas schloesseri]
MGKGDDSGELDMDALKNELGDSADESYEIEDDVDVGGDSEVDVSAKPAGASTTKARSKPASVAPEDSGALFSEPSDSGAPTGRADSKPAAAASSKPPSVRAPAASAPPSKPPSAPPSKPGSVAPEKSGADLSGGLSGLSLSGDVSANDLGPSVSASASKSRSQAPSRPGTALGAARPTASAAGSTAPAPAPASAAPSASRRSTPPASVAPSVTGAGPGGSVAGGRSLGGGGGGNAAGGNSNSYNSDEFGDILGPSASAGDVAATTPSAAKPAAAKPSAAAAPSSTRGGLGSHPASGYTTPRGAPGSVSGSVPPATASAAAASASGSHPHSPQHQHHHVTFSPNSSLRPPQPTDSPAASRAGRLGLGGTLQHSGSRRTQTHCDIPTPFELFRLYDKDNNGSVTLAEFERMLRDLEGRPVHFPQEEDPEWRSERAAARKKRKEAALEKLESKLTAATEQPATPKEALEELHAAQARVKADIAAEAAKVEAEREAVAALRAELTPELRREREEWRRWVAAEFDRADLGGSGEILSIDEFYMYFYGKLCFRFPVTRTGVNPGAALFNIFVKYCSFGRGAVGGRNEDMLSHQFAKLCKDARLMNGKTVTKATVDIIYHRSRAADEALETYVYKAGVAATARMYYPQFLFALNKLAEKRKSGFQEVVALILQSVDALPEPSFADFVVLSGHELEHGEELPEYLLRPRALPSNARSLRSRADNDLLRKMKEESKLALALSTGNVGAAIRAADGYGPPPGEASAGLRAHVDARRAKGPAGEVEDVVAMAAEGAAAGGGAGQAAPQTLTGMLGQSQDGAALAALADDDTASDAGGRRLTRNESDASGRGGSGLPVRGSVYAGLPPPGLTEAALRRKEWEQPEPEQLAGRRDSLRASGVHPVHSAEMMHEVRALDPDTLMASLKRVFESYAGWGGGVDRGALDRVRWGKVLRDCLLVSESGPLPARKADAVFGKVLPPSSRALNFIQFIEGLRHVALHHRLALNEVMERLVAVGGPRPGG